MAFTVADFGDLVRLLEQHPEWRAELRRLVLTEDELGLSAALRRLADAQAQTDERVARLETAVAALVEAQVRTEGRLGNIEVRLEGIDGRLDGVDRRLEGIDGRLDGVDRRLNGIDGRMDRVGDRLGHVLGNDLERRYRERASAYFSDVVHRPRPLSAQRLADLLDSPESDERLSAAERRDVLLADLVVSGQPVAGEGDVYLVVEVSVGIGPSDVERAIRRTALLGRLRPTLAAVAGESITAEAEELAQERGVWRILDGRASPPEARAS